MLDIIKISSAFLLFILFCFSTVFVMVETEDGMSIVLTVGISLLIATLILG